jgi:hypothetical protein
MHCMSGRAAEPKAPVQGLKRDYGAFFINVTGVRPASRIVTILGSDGNPVEGFSVIVEIEQAP